MDHERVKGATDTTKGVVKNTSGKQAEPKFDKPLGSSHNDEVDLRDRGAKGGRKVPVTATEFFETVPSPFRAETHFHFGSLRSGL